VDDFYGLDRLDRWLNSRQGKQRAVLNWYPIFMLGCYLGLLGWFTWAFFGSPPFLLLPVIVAAVAVLAVPLRRLTPAMYARRCRRHPGKADPQFTWRWIVLAVLFAAEEALAAVNGSIGQSLPRGPKLALSSLQMILAVSAFPVLLTAYRYRRRYVQARQWRPADPPWPAARRPGASQEDSALPMHRGAASASRGREPRA
jgi:hypothetical protein